MNKWVETHPLEYRALIILRNCNKKDEYYGRGKGDLTVDWVKEQIQKGCTYKDQCGTTDWRKVGLNRKDNSLPHTKDNCEPCCFECNNRLHTQEQKKQVDQIDILSGEIIATYPSAYEAAKENGFDQGAISKCCLGKRNKHKNYIWKYASSI